MVPAREDALDERPGLVEGDLVHKFFEVGGAPRRQPLADAVRPGVVARHGEERSWNRERSWAR
jgi:hypothetical protein